MIPRHQVPVRTVSYERSNPYPTPQPAGAQPPDPLSSHPRRCGVCRRRGRSQRMLHTGGCRPRQHRTRPEHGRSSGTSSAAATASACSRCRTGTARPTRPPSWRPSRSRGATRTTPSSSLATVGDKPPNVAVAHLTRVKTLVAATCCRSCSPEDLARHGMSADKFNKRAWEAGLVDGKAYAIPIDTHPFVLFYNTDICKQAGLLDDDGKLKPIEGADAFADALRSVKKVTGQFGATHGINADTASPWRFFQTLYSQLGGEVLADDGTRIVLDDAKAKQVLDYMRTLTGREEADARGASTTRAPIALFASGAAGFHLNGEWEITTFQTAKMPFSMTLVPNIFGGAVRRAGRLPHAGPAQAARPGPGQKLDLSLGFIKSMLDQSLTWAEGGHVPTWQPFATERRVQEAHAAVQLRRRRRRGGLRPARAGTPAPVRTSRSSWAPPSAPSRRASSPPDAAIAQIRDEAVRPRPDPVAGVTVTRGGWPWPPPPIPSTAPDPTPTDRAPDRAERPDQAGPARAAVPRAVPGALRAVHHRAGPVRPADELLRHQPGQAGPRRLRRVRQLRRGARAARTSGPRCGTPSGSPS